MTLVTSPISCGGRRASSSLWETSKNPLPVGLTKSVAEEEDGDAILSCSHVDRDGLLHPQYLHDKPQALYEISKMHIGLINVDFLNSQEQEGF